MSTTTPTPPNNCTGTGRRCPSTWTGLARKARHTSRRTGCGDCPFTPGPSGFRFYHTHLVPGADLSLGQYNGQVGPVYIEPNNPGAYDQEVFLTLKEFEPAFSRGGDMAADFLAGQPIPELREKGEAAMAASLASGKPRGFEVGYGAFAINGCMLGHGDPIKVTQGQRVLLHVLNASATETRSLALPGHTFNVLALDGNPVARPVEVPVLWLGAAERISAIVHFDQPREMGAGDWSDDDRGNGMGTVVEYAGSTGEPRWAPPPPFTWDYRLFTQPGATTATPDHTIELLIEKRNAEHDGFWTSPETVEACTMRSRYARDTEEVRSRVPGGGGPHRPGHRQADRPGGSGPGYQRGHPGQLGRQGPR